MLNQHGEQIAANVFEKAVYKLHETFDTRQTQSMTEAPPYPETRTAKPRLFQT